MAQMTRKFVGGTVQSVIVAQDYELSTMGAPENPETLLELVHTAGVVVTVLGYYYWNGAEWTLIGGTAPQQAQLITSPSGGVAILLPDGSKGGILAGNVVTVGAKGMYLNLQAAIDDIGSRFVVRRSKTENIALTNGSATVTGTGTSWPGTTATADNVGVGDLIKFGTDTRYYKIKSVNSATSMTLWEPYQGATSSGNIAYTTSYLDRVSLLILPGHLGYSGAVMQPGYDLVSLNPLGTAVGEISSANPFPITNFGENNIFGVGFQPSNVWGDLDHMVGVVNPNLWAGAENVIANSVIVNANLRKYHSGGALYYPVQNGGRITYRDCMFKSSRTPCSVAGGAVTPTTANTEVNFDAGNRFEFVIDTETYTGEINTGAIQADAIATYNFMAPIVSVPDFVVPSFLGDCAGIVVSAPAATGVGSNVVNIHDPFVRVANSGTRNAYGIQVTGACTVNLSGADVDAAGTSGTGLVCNNAGATVNIRGGCRFKGSTNSINNVAGTVNKSTSQPPILIGATAGTVTALDT